MLWGDPLEMSGRVEMTVCGSDRDRGLGSDLCIHVYIDVHHSSGLSSRILVVTHAPRCGMERVRQTIRLLACPSVHPLIVHRSWC